MVLEILFPKPGDAQPDFFSVDIVAIHGLNGDPTNTWKHSANNHFWIQDSLPLDVNGARILNYGYNTDVVFGNTIADVWDHAKSLLGSLIDERETDDESKRPIVFIAHSLGGIIVKQALVWAQREPRYQAITKNTLGIVFFGTPHRGSDKANYGKILANVATGVMHKPKSKLIGALQSNSETLMRLTSEFKFQAPDMRILTFYETKPMGLFSSLIVEKQSALLELSHEDTQPVDANHQDMCKFDSRSHETYKKLVKRVNRMLKEGDESMLAPDYTSPNFRNEYFELPFDVSPYYTGGQDLLRKLRMSCLPLEGSPTINSQKRFILYGLGGSGKTQTALKFASDHRERFWGVFFIDTSGINMAEQGFSTMARICKVGDRMDDFKRYLTNSRAPWLLILDNADDPSLDIAQFFPVGNRGIIIVTSRNPECRSHATVGSVELREMETDEAIDLLLRSGDLLCEDQNLRRLALPIVQTLGYLALAVNHAGASIRQKTCSLQDYLDHYTRHRKKLLSSQQVQAHSEYKYTVYTTWEISVESIKKLAGNSKVGTAANALELLTFFGFCHFDDITEDIFRSAWNGFTRIKGYRWWASNVLGMIRDDQSSNWATLLFNETVQLLSSYSLIHVSGRDSRISLHPLVHSWIRDSLSEEEHLRWWYTTVSTLALVNCRSFQHQRQIMAHLRHCIGTRRIEDLFQEDDVALDRVELSSVIIDIYACYPWRDGLTLSERAFEYSQRTLGDDCYSTCELSCQLAKNLNHSNQYQDASDLLKVRLEVTMQVAGPADRLTLRTVNQLAWAYIRLGRVQAALELAQESLAICEESVDQTDDVYLGALEIVAMGYGYLGRYEECIEFSEKALAKGEEISNVEDKGVLRLELRLGQLYRISGQPQAALDILQSTLEKHLRVLGEDHPNTPRTMVAIAYTYGDMGQLEKAIPLVTKALDIGSRTGLENERLQKWEKYLEWLQSKTFERPKTVPERPPKPRETRYSEGEGMSSRSKWRIWPKFRGGRERSPS